MDTGDAEYHPPRKHEDDDHQQEEHQQKAEECGCERRSVLADEPELVRVVHEGDEDVALQLLSAGGIDPNLRTRAGYPLLHMAALSDLSGFAGQLLAMGADPNALDRDGTAVSIFPRTDSPRVGYCLFCGTDDVRDGGLPDGVMVQDLRPFITAQSGKRRTPLRPSSR